MGLKPGKCIVLVAVLVVLGGFSNAAQLRNVAAVADRAFVEKWENGGRAAILDWFSENWFGRKPVERPADEVIGSNYVEMASGKMRINIHASLPDCASASNPAPTFVFGDHSNAGSGSPNDYTFRDAIVARGYAYVRFNLNDIALNVFNSIGTNGVHTFYGGLGKPDSWGTIAEWAWGFSRVIDWIETQSALDARRIAVIGHSRGGKAALWAGCNDKRIALTISNCSGTGGARSLRTPVEGCETVDRMSKSKLTRSWFCDNWFGYANREAEIEHDADDLMKLVAPRLLYVASGSLDAWAGPPGEFAAARKASELWRAYGRKGLSLDRFPAPGVWDHSGEVGYHLRSGRHGLTLWDWERYMDFMDRRLPGSAPLRESP